MENFRIENDSLGEVRVPADRLWGAQTQRSLENFKIGTERMPREIIIAFALMKKACAMANKELGVLEADIADAIFDVCGEIYEGRHESEFPLVVWQTGSGTQTNMNVNEVIANRASKILGRKVHPNDHVNRSQSSNDTFPSAMHITAVQAVEDYLLPSLDELKRALDDKASAFSGIEKVGRTHLQDAANLTLGQEFGGYAAMCARDGGMINAACGFMKTLALGGTAVGTGINCPDGFDELVAKKVSELTGKEFLTSANKFHALTSHDELVFVHGAMKALAADLMKIANDIRWMGSGPRCGIGELRLPENEPGSSIMPGKVNPTQCESLTMIAVQVIANDAAVGMAASQGNFELNVFMPVLIYNFLQSARLMADGMLSFTKNCVRGIEPNIEIIERYSRVSLMNVTRLVPIIGYDKAVKIAQMAQREGLTIDEAERRFK